MTSRHADKSNGERRLVNHQVMSQRSHDSKLLTPHSGRHHPLSGISRLSIQRSSGQRGCEGACCLDANEELKGAMSSQPRTTPGSCLPPAEAAFTQQAQSSYSDCVCLEWLWQWWREAHGKATAPPRRPLVPPQGPALPRVLFSKAEHFLAPEHNTLF